MNKKVITLFFLMIFLFPVLGDEANSAIKKISFRGITLVLEAGTTREGIDARISLEKNLDEEIGVSISPIFMLEGPYGKTTIPTVSSKCQTFSKDCKSIKAVFELWCNDRRTGWDLVGLFVRKGFMLVGKTKSDSLVGFWKVIAMDGETGEKIGEVEVWVKRAKPDLGPAGNS